MPVRRIQRRIYSKLAVTLVVVSAGYCGAFFWLVGSLQEEELSLLPPAMGRYAAFFVLGLILLGGAAAYLFRPQGRLIQALELMEKGEAGDSEGVSSDDELIAVVERQRQELKFRSDELRSLLDALPAYIWFKDDRNNIVRVNKAAAESTGLSIEELEGKAVKDVFPDEADAYFEDDRAVIESGVPKLGYIETYTPEKGKARTIRTDKIPYVDTDGKVTGVVALVTDISELVDLQEERQASERLIRRLVEIGNWESSDVYERIAAALKDTCETLGMKTGVLSEISGDSYSVREVYDERGLLSVGDCFKLSEVYCNILMKAGRSIASNHVGESEWAEMDCYKTLGLESYIASPIRMGGEITGTINFSAPEARAKPFTAFEIDAVRLLSNWIEGLLRQEEIVAQLNRQKAELRLILDTTPSQIWFKDSENRILRANRAAASYLGKTVEEVEGKTAGELMPEESARSWEEEREVLESGEPLLGRVRSKVAESGQRVWHRYDRLPYELENSQRGVIVVVSEITELVESQNAAREADERFRVAVEEAPMGMLLVDSGLRVILVNREAERIFGYERKTLLWRSVDRLLGGRVVTALECLFDADGKVEEQVRLGADGELQISRNDESTLPVEVMLSPYSLSEDSYAMVSVLDISERVESQKALQDSEERFQLAAEGASVGIWDWFDVDGVEAWWSPRFYELIGYDPGELEPTLETFKGLLHPTDRESAFAAVEKSFQDGTPFAADYRLRCKNGEYRWFLGSGMVSFDAKGVPRRMTGTIQDINDRKEAEEELSKVVTDLKRANEELSDFAFLSSHDLQEPLRTISSFLLLLKERYGQELDADANEYMDFTLVAAKRLQNMIRSLLNYCRLDARERVESLFSLQEALEMALGDLAKRIEERGAEIEVSERLGEVYGDIDQVSLVFQNLIGNALKFNRSGKPKVQVGCRRVSSAEIAREGLEACDYTVVSVKDNGIGIREKYQKKIFSIFQKLHPSGEYEGSGIGLSMVQKIMQRHNGFVWLESEEGKGACFYLAFPIRSRD
ncbi:PAS domain S-box protein [Pelagicoccus sp. SDUM812005]|uniref:PAS domain S-box protein n=1 Tax=Pelagicoccus sp. SDUM812005 TaxID=3041257 RepID=UPI00280C6DC2|nr:PAS domain S-box protein [Pelagicoccus sp. SDUM812005]MDQ8179222.1 PAS domain S-box protein [Pelagicoccus sp. SDUM812005]